MYNDAQKASELQGAQKYLHQVETKQTTVSLVLDDFEKMLARLDELSHKATLIADRIMGARPTPIAKDAGRDEIQQRTIFRRLEDQRQNFNVGLNRLQNTLDRIDAAL